MYDPTLGRFLSVDPLVAITGDAYGYGNNNPIRYSDPSGLEAGANGEEKSCSVSGDCGGRFGHKPDPITDLFIGAPQASQYWAQQSGQFFSQISQHLAKGADMVVLDLTGFAPNHASQVMWYVSSLGQSASDKLWTIGAG